MNLSQLNESTMHDFFIKPFFTEKTDIGSYVSFLLEIKKYVKSMETLQKMEKKSDEHSS